MHLPNQDEFMKREKSDECEGKKGMDLFIEQYSKAFEAAISIDIEEIRKKHTNLEEFKKEAHGYLDKLMRRIDKSIDEVKISIKQIEK